MEDGNTPTRRTVVRAVGGAVGVGLVGPESTAGRIAGTDRTERRNVGTVAENVVRNQTASNWPQLHGDAAKTGAAPSGPTTPNVTWRYDEGDETWYGRPVVDESVYVATSESLLSLTTDGEKRWASDDGLVYSTPAVADGIVYVGAGATEGGDDGGTESALVAFEAETGTELWRTSRVGESMGVPTVADGTVYVVSPATMRRNGRLYAVDAASGKVQWCFDLGTTGSSGHTTAPVAVTEGVVYVAAGGLYALDAETGEQRWVTNTDTTLKGVGKNAPTVVGDTVYVGTGGYGGRFYAVSTADGSVQWTYQVTDKSGFDGVGQFTSAAVHKGSVFVVYQGIDNTPSGVYAFDAAEGSKRWFTENDRFVSPVAAGTLVYVGTMAFDAADGAVLWRVDAENPTSVALDDGVLYTGGASVLAVTTDD